MVERGERELLATSDLLLAGELLSVGELLGIREGETVLEEQAASEALPDEQELLKADAEFSVVTVALTEPVPVNDAELDAVAQLDAVVTPDCDALADADALGEDEPLLEPEALEDDEALVLDDTLPEGVVEANGVDDDASDAEAVADGRMTHRSVSLLKLSLFEALH